MTIKKTATKSSTKTPARKAPSRKPAAPVERAVLVTTTHRGVFIGMAVDVHGETITLRACRNIIYWPADCQGFLGLAAKGPTKGTKVGPAATITLRNITAVAELSAAARGVFEALS